MEDTFQYLPSKIQLFSEMLHTAYRIGTWCLGHGDQTVLFATTSEHQNTLQTFLKISGALDYIFQSKDVQRPVFFSDALGGVWVGEWITREMPAYNGLLFVLGPVLYGTSTAKKLEDLLRSIGYSQQIFDSLSTVLQKLPVIDPSAFLSIGIMLHFILTGEEISVSDCIYQAEPSVKHSTDGEDEEQVPGYDEGLLETEAFLMRIVREGDVAGAKRHGGKRKLGKPLDLKLYDPMREMKDTLIVFTALCVRAAIEGGLSVRVAKSLEEQYIAAIETTRLPTALTDLSMTMFLDFTQRVHNLISGPERSKPILDCCAYIQANLTNQLDLKAIAAEVGYSEYYLTKKFAAEMGMRLSEYIKQQRIECAKIWLVTTDKSVQEISNALRFSSRNYFSSVFQALEGVTPVAYRSQHTRKGGTSCG